MFDALNIQFQQVNDRDPRFGDDMVERPLRTRDDAVISERKALPFLHLAAKLQQRSRSFHLVDVQFGLSRLVGHRALKHPVLLSAKTFLERRGLVRKWLDHHAAQQATVARETEGESPVISSDINQMDRLVPAQVLQQQPRNSIKADILEAESGLQSLTPECLQAAPEDWFFPDHGLRLECCRRPEDAAARAKPRLSDSFPRRRQILKSSSVKAVDYLPNQPAWQGWPAGRLV